MPRYDLSLVHIQKVCQDQSAGHGRCPLSGLQGKATMLRVLRTVPPWSSQMVGTEQPVVKVPVMSRVFESRLAMQMNSEDRPVNELWLLSSAQSRIPMSAVNKSSFPLLCLLSFTCVVPGLLWPELGKNHLGWGLALALILAST